jgi:hypothetical protein
MSLPNNKLTIITDNPICANGAVENSDASYSTTVVSGGLLTLPDSQINVNSVDSGDVVSVKTIDVNLEDSLGAPVTPTSVGLVGNTLTIEVPNGSSPSGVLFQFPILKQFTSYADYDTGWRVQNGWNDFTIPTNPKVIAKLDMTLGANYPYRLTENLIVGGVASKVRFVDVKGVQSWGVTNNVNLITIDKLTGLGIYRFTTSSTTWALHLTAAESLNINVDGNTYNSFYLADIDELNAIFGFFQNTAGGQGIDQVSSATFFSGQNADYTTSTTRADNTGQAFNKAALLQITQTNKVNSTRAIYIFDARSLITAP